MSSSIQGQTSDRYKVVPRTLVFITRGDKVLLLKGAADKSIWANLYNGICGHIERGVGRLLLIQEKMLEFVSIYSGASWVKANPNRLLREHWNGYLNQILTNIHWLRIYISSCPGYLR
jgi:hypothetical protein